MKGWPLHLPSGVTLLPLGLLFDKVFIKPYPEVQAHSTIFLRMFEQLLADVEPDEEEEVTKVEEKEKPKTYVFDVFFVSNGSLTQTHFS